jgi:hypothetical protein
MIPQQIAGDDFSVIEWLRLDGIAAIHERGLRNAFLQTVVQRQETNSLIIRNVITDTVVETAVSSAHAYDMVFNPNAPAYRRLIDALTDTYMNRVMNDDSAKEQVRQIVPTGLSLSELRNRLDTFGLDGRSAVRLERMRQEGATDAAIQAERLSLTTQRGNILALTEINRIINATLEVLWIENLQGISKANKKVEGSQWFYESGGDAVTITSLVGIPKSARKEIVTRKDNRVCVYCEPLDRTTARLGTEFRTGYGLFMSPPFHPRCRCYMIVRF